MYSVITCSCIYSTTIYIYYWIAMYRVIIRVYCYVSVIDYKHIASFNTFSALRCIICGSCCLIVIKAKTTAAHIHIIYMCLCCISRTIISLYINSTIINNKYIFSLYAIIRSLNSYITAFNDNISFSCVCIISWLNPVWTCININITRYNSA